MLNFNESSDDEAEAESGDEEAVHSLPDKLEVPSDESDFEDDESEVKSAKSGKYFYGKIIFDKLLLCGDAFYSTTTEFFPIQNFVFLTKILTNYFVAGKVTQTMISEWTEELENQPTQKTIVNVVEAFRAAVSTVGSG